MRNPVCYMIYPNLLFNPSSLARMFGLFYLKGAVGHGYSCNPRPFQLGGNVRMMLMSHW